MSAGGAHRTTKYTGWRDKPISIKEFLEISKKPIIDKSRELVLRLEHKEYRNVFLRIWISSSHQNIMYNGSISSVYIRIDHTQNSSSPLRKDDVYTLMFPETKKIAEFYEFGHTPISELSRILEIVKHLKPAILPIW
jgi:hypothetical protein